MLFDVGEPEVKPAARETHKEKVKREWNEIRSATNALLDRDRALLEAFRGRLTLLFVEMKGKVDEPFNRRPNVSLRLIAAGEPKAKLIVLPHVRHDATGGYLVPSEHTIELLQEKPLRAGGKDAMQYSRRLDFKNVASFAMPPRVNYIYKSAPDDARRILETIREFMADARAVLARGCDHCCVCGRGLTDEFSRSRGIGPECIQKLPFIEGVITSESIVVPETPVVA